MEFHEKLQILRKEKGLTQEELAEHLYVSRAAISKWESGRGYPNIDSLKAIAGFFSVTIDELLSSGEVLTLAEKEAAQKRGKLCGQILGCLDCSAAILYVLPIFGQTVNGQIQGGFPVFSDGNSALAESVLFCGDRAVSAHGNSDTGTAKQTRFCMGETNNQRIPACQFASDLSVYPEPPALWGCNFLDFSDP